jgi:hypothetical protein
MLGPEKILEQIQPLLPLLSFLQCIRIKAALDKSWLLSAWSYEECRIQ